MTYGNSDNDHRVATIFKIYLIVAGIVIQEKKLIERSILKLTIRAFYFEPTIYRQTFDQ